MPTPPTIPAWMRWRDGWGWNRRCSRNASKSPWESAPPPVVFSEVASSPPAGIARSSDASEHGRATGTLLASADLNPEAIAPWRTLARGLANAEGDGDLERGARNLIEHGAQSERVAGFRQGALEVLEQVNAPTPGDRVDALHRHLVRELQGVVVEEILGYRSAWRLPTFRQEQVYRLERPLQDAMGRQLAARDGPVQGARVFHLMLARAIQEVEAAKEIRGISPPVEPPQSAERARAVVTKALARGLQSLNELVQAIGLPVRVALVPLEYKGPEVQAVVGGFSASQPPSPGAPAEQEPASPFEEEGQEGERKEPPRDRDEGRPRAATGPTKPVSLHSWSEQIRRVVEELGPRLAPCLGEFLVVPV